MSNYKLDLTFDISVNDPSPPNKSCLMCMSDIEENWCSLTVEKPLIQTLYFDLTCYSQIIATGIKFLREFQEQEINH